MLLSLPWKKPIGGRDVPPSAQAKIHGAARFIRGAIEVDPIGLQFSVRAPIGPPVTAS